MRYVLIFALIIAAILLFWPEQVKMLWHHSSDAPAKDEEPAATAAQQGISPADPAAGANMTALSQPAASPKSTAWMWEKKPMDGPHDAEPRRRRH